MAKTGLDHIVWKTELEPRLADWQKRSAYDWSSDFLSTYYRLQDELREMTRDEANDMLFDLYRLMLDAKTEGEREGFDRGWEAAKRRYDK